MCAWGTPAERTKKRDTRDYDKREKASSDVIEKGDPVEMKKIIKSDVENGEEISLTRPQILKIIVKLRKSEITIFEKTKIYEIHQKTKFGNICLN